VFRHVVLALFFVLSGLLHGSDLEEKSPTEDEWAHLVRGMQYLAGEDTRLQYAHPPLANAITASTVAFEEGLPDFSRLDGWERANVGAVSTSYLRLGYADARDRLMSARRLQLLVLWAGILYAYAWGCSLFGWTTGSLLAFMMSVHPTLLAQARYVNTDLACGLMFLVVAGELARYRVTGSRFIKWVFIPLALSAAVLVKHSGLILVPVVLIVGLVAALRARRSAPCVSRRWRLCLWAVHAAYVGLVLVVAIDVAYGFQETGLSVGQLFDAPEPQYWVSEPYRQRMLEAKSPLAYLPSDMPVPLPRTWIFGVTAVGVQTQQGYEWSSFLGVRTPEGHPAYFPLLLLLKTPCVLILLATVAFARRPSVSEDLRQLWPVGLAFLVYLLLAMSSNLSMGIRHGLPLICLVLPFAALGAARTWEDHVRSRWARLAFVVAIASLLIPAVVHVDDYLGYFNIGRKLGHQVSVVGEDVGQDRLRFAQEARKRRLWPLFYDTQTAVRAMEARHARLRYIELDCKTRLPAGSYAALHVSRRHRVGTRCMAQLVGLAPEFVFNDHIEVYRIPRRTRR
jgi:hypothetical protein